MSTWMQLALKQCSNTPNCQCRNTSCVMRVCSQLLLHFLLDTLHHLATKLLRSLHMERVWIYMQTRLSEYIWRGFDFAQRQRNVKGFLVIEERHIPGVTYTQWPKLAGQLVSNTVLSAQQPVALPIRLWTTQWPMLAGKWLEIDGTYFEMETLRPFSQAKEEHKYKQWCAHFSSVIDTHLLAVQRN